MVKRKSKAVISAADPTGGVSPIIDRRFERGAWPFQLEIAPAEAETWLRYLAAECRLRDWPRTAFEQLEAKENSGTVAIKPAADLELAITWERKRGGPLTLRARFAGATELPAGRIQELLDSVSDKCRAGVTDRFFVAGQLYYDGLPWRGEIWLSEDLRLGPPSVQYEAAVLGPRVILIAAHVEAIDAFEARDLAPVRVRELSVFLSVLMGTHVTLETSGSSVWTWAVKAGEVETETRTLGYYERGRSPALPAKGIDPPLPLVAVARPDLAPGGIRSDDMEQHLPTDTSVLWKAFANLSQLKRQQFLQAGSLWQLAISLGHEFETTRFALMVAACEALKPPLPGFRDHNIYHVVEALLGTGVAETLQEQWFRPQEVRNVHFHSGEFRGSEFERAPLSSSYQDPTFATASRTLWLIAPAAILEWLHRGGEVSLAAVERRPTWRRWLRNHSLFLLPILFLVGLVLGAILWRVLGG